MLGVGIIHGGGHDVVGQVLVGQVKCDLDSILLGEDKQTAVLIDRQ
jgi:hypothetical protein